MRRQQLLREPALAGGTIVVADAPVGGRVERRHPRARALPDRGRKAGVVEMVVGQEHELDVLDGEIERGELLLERGQGLVAARPGVDQRPRLALEQPHVDRPEVGDGEEELGGFGHRVH